MMGVRRIDCAQSGLSLIEVLGAVAIIWLCFGFILPLITSSRQAATRRLATTECLAISDALMEYRRVYGAWPAQTQAVSDVVYGLDDGPSPKPIYEAIRDNPRRLHLLTIEGPQVVDGVMHDPWDRAYLLVMDEDGDGQVSIDVPDLFRTNVSSRAVVMSYGQDQAAIRIRSWDASGKPE